MTRKDLDKPDIQPFEANYFGLQIMGTYDYNRILARHTMSISHGDVMDRVVEMLSACLVSWNLNIDDDGETYPWTKESLSELPANFLNSVLEGIVNAQHGLPPSTFRE